MTRLLERTQLDQRLDEVRRDGEEPGFFDALSLAVLPHGTQAPGRSFGPVCDQVRQPEGAVRIELVERDTDHRRALELLLRPVLGLGGLASTGGEMGPIALDDRVDHHIALGG